MTYSPCHCLHQAKTHMNSGHPLTQRDKEESVDTRLPTTRLLNLAVVICNYNYAEYISEAIDSALAIDWPCVQVVVVDDGSTDASPTVIAQYEGRISSFFQSNGGQYTAYNKGFTLAKEADVIIFLDSDDLLDRNVMREVSAVWRPGLSKVQFRLRGINAGGAPLGNEIPQFHLTPTPEEIRQWCATTTAHPTPPGSGNAYSRTFLEQILPLDDSCGKPGDASCVAAAPYLGDVLTLPFSLGSYRIHGRNDGAASRLDIRQFQLHVVRAHQRHVYAQGIARRVGIEVPDNAINRSLSYLPYRLASLRLSPVDHPLPGDCRISILRDAWLALTYAQGMSRQAKCLIVTWITLVGLLPITIARQLILWRFVPAARPQGLKAVLFRLGILR